MKRCILYRWAFAIIMAIASFNTVYTDGVLITSLDQLWTGTTIKIYPHGKGGESSFALACSGNGEALTSYSKAGDGAFWVLENAGDGCYYLRNELGCYWAYQNNSALNSLTCTTDINSAVKVKLTWNSVYDGISFWNQEDGHGLNNLRGMFYMYNWWEPNLNKVDDVNDVFGNYSAVSA